MDWQRIDELEKHIAEKKDELTFSESLTSIEKDDLTDQIRDLNNELDEVLED